MIRSSNIYNLRFEFSNTCMIQKKKKKKGIREIPCPDGRKIWLQEGSIARASYFRTRPGTASSAAADPRAASSARRGTVWPFDRRYRLHRVYRTRRMATSKCSTLQGTEGSTRAFKVSDQVTRSSPVRTSETRATFLDLYSFIRQLSIDMNSLRELFINWTEHLIWFLKIECGE